MSAAAGGFRDPKILSAFILITLIWGATWIVIKDQLGTVPPSWSIAYRFAFGSAGMFAIAWMNGATLKIGRKGHLLAAAFGVPQFFLNFNFVYAAEHFITSGLVAVVFALLIVPNSVFTWIFFRQKLTVRFMAGSAVALMGVALLFAQEIRIAAISPAAVLTGIGLTFLGVLSASAANVMQVSESLRSRPVDSMLAWAMLYGTLLNALFALTLHGPPVIEYRAGYWLGLLYLGLIASALTFSLYFRIIREVGPAKAAYSSVLVPVIAMTLSTLFEGYVWSPVAYAGGILAMTGLVIALRARRAPG